MHVDPRSAVGRGVRALVLSAVAVAAAGAAHAYVDGCLDLVGLLLALGLAWPAAVPLLGRRRAPAALLGWAAGAQVVTHVVLAATCGGPAPPLPRHVLLAHATGVVLTTLVLARADARLWLAHLVHRALARLRPPLLIPLVPRVALAVPLVVSPVSTRPTAPRRRRGPPSALLPTP